MPYLFVIYIKENIIIALYYELVKRLYTGELQIILYNYLMFYLNHICKK